MKIKNKNFYVKKMQKGSILLIVLLCFLLCACTRRSELSLNQMTMMESEDSEHTDSSSEIKEEPEPEAVPEEKKAFVYVHVCGAVKNPGVYELPEGSRVFEAVQAAGGFTQEAQQAYVNQAQEVLDGDMLVIPTLEQAENLAGYGLLNEGMTAQETDADKNGLVNLNTAQKEELCTLPGIGEAKAEAILAYREKKGSFTAKEELKNIEGIKDGVYLKIEDKIYVE